MRKVILLANLFIFVCPFVAIISLGMLALWAMMTSINPNLMGFLMFIFLIVVGIAPAASLLVLYINELYPEMINLEKKYWHIANIFSNIGAATAALSIAAIFIEHFHAFDGYKYSYLLNEIRATFHTCMFGIPLLIPYFFIKVLGQNE